MALEDAAIARATDVVVLDTDLVSTVVYCEHYFGRCPEWIVEEARRRAGQLYLLMRPDITWVADGVRDRGHMRDEMHALFATKLEQLALHFVEIGGTRDERFERALDAIAALR
jgi:nicotinamide riboside kinase